MSLKMCGDTCSRDLVLRDVNGEEGQLLTCDKEDCESLRKGMKDSAKLMTETIDARTPAACDQMREECKATLTSPRGLLDLVILLLVTLGSLRIYVKEPMSLQIVTVIHLWKPLLHVFLSLGTSFNIPGVYEKTDELNERSKGVDVCTAASPVFCLSGFS